MNMKLIFRYVLVSIWIALPVTGISSAPQERQVNQKKIDKEREKRQKEAMKEYNKALKEHHKHQSKETKAMMRQSRKESGKNTPLKKK
jgi:uncharacterized membrane protein (DUF106 family)